MKHIKTSKDSHECYLIKKFKSCEKCIIHHKKEGIERCVREPAFLESNMKRDNLLHDYSGHGNFAVSDYFCLGCDLKTNGCAEKCKRQ